MSAKYLVSTPMNSAKEYIEFASTAKQDTVYNAITTMANVTSGSISCQGYIGTSVFSLAEATSTTVILYSIWGPQLGPTITNGSSTKIGISLQIEVMTKRTPTNT